jgi:hypothetical protein
VATREIDFETFLCLTAAIAAAGCGAPRPPPAAQSLDTTQGGNVIALGEPEEPTPETIQSAEPATSAEPAPDSGSACNNDAGEVSCDFIDPRKFGGPACEGFAGTCELLRKGHSYRLRVGAAAARCFEKRGLAACNMQVRTQCYRAALQEACPDSSYAAFCDAALARCKEKHLRPDFSATECVLALSSLEGGDLGWAQDSIGPSAEGCKLMFPVF